MSVRGWKMALLPLRENTIKEEERKKERKRRKRKVSG